MSRIDPVGALGAAVIVFAVFAFVMALRADKRALAFQEACEAHGGVAVSVLKRLEGYACVQPLLEGVK